jgi:DNA-binding transcriptional regulator YhcF (GntR family)
MEREGLSRAVRGVGSVVAEDAHRHAARRARQALDRELEATVGVARRLGLELDNVIAALRRRWKE